MIHYLISYNFLILEMPQFRRSKKHDVFLFVLFRENQMNRRDDINNLFKKPKKVAYCRNENKENISSPGFKIPNGANLPVFKIANGANKPGSKIPNGANSPGFKIPNESNPPEFKSPSGSTPLDSKSPKGPTPQDTKYPTYGSKFA